MTFYRTSIFILALLTAFTSPVSAEPAADARKSTAELEALRDQIQKIKNEIGQRRGESDALSKQLEKSEVEVEKAIKESRKLDEKIRKQNEALESLKKQQEEKTEALSQHKDFMMEQIRVAYINQNQSTLKMVLNQEDTASFSRNMVYHRYFAAARSQKIAQVGQQIKDLQETQKVVTFESEQLRLLQFSQKDNLKKLEQKKQDRQLVIARLDKQVSSKGAQLNRMQRDAETLNALINSLNKTAANLARLARLEKAKRNVPAFANLKGKLRWPAAGGIIHRYGTSRNNSSLNWQGVLINAKLGSDVKAVSGGRVIFSDWFQNLGRLIIIDHGGGYMSLYGHNQDLFRSVGDKVKTGELIASVGDTGGRKNSGLYFEVRRKGTPVNPATWCKGSFK
jgi:septal ring factor EnvC (AmiA/AmiB activator)